MSRRGMARWDMARIVHGIYESPDMLSNALVSQFQLSAFLDYRFMVDSSPPTFIPGALISLPIREDSSLSWG